MKLINQALWINLMNKIILMILLKSEIFILTINLHYNLKHIPQFSVNLIYSQGCWKRGAGGFCGVDIFPNKKIIKNFSSNQRSSNFRKQSLKVCWKKNFS